MSMGEGGVACMPSQHVMERLPISDTYFRGNGGFSSKSMQFTEQQLERKHDKRMVVDKQDFCSQNAAFSQVKEGEVEKGEIVPQKDEVEEGEVGYGRDPKIEIENGEFIPEKLRRREVENEEFIHGKWRRGGGEFVPEKRQKWELERTEFPSGRRLVSEVEKGEFIPDKLRKREVDKLDSFSGRRGQRGELERGEVHYKSRKEGQEAFSSLKGPKRDTERDEFAKGWAPERKLTEEDAYQRKDLSRSSGEFTKRHPRWDPGYSRDTKIGFRTSDDELGPLKREANEGKSYSKDYSVSWQKRQGTNSGINGRRHHDDLLDLSNPKSRRIYEDNNRAGYFEEKSYRNTSSSRYASKHYDSSVSRRAHDRHGPSPGYFERSPHDRGRHHDHRGRSPVPERSPNDQARYYDHRNRSPSRRSPYRSRQNDRRDCSPGYLDRSPLGRGRSPHVRARYHDRRDRTPGYLESSPHDFIRSPRHDCRDSSPGYLDRSPPDYGRSPYLQTRHNNCREHTPGHLERSPHDRGRSHDYHKDNQNRKGREDENILVGEPDGDYKIGLVDSTKRDPNDHSSTRQPQFDDIIDNGSVSLEINTNNQSLKEEKPQNPTVDCLDPPQVSGTAEEVSMEEDMDISNTPPHVQAVDDSALGTWFYLDNFGMEQGTSKLCNLKRLVEEGVLQTDHLIKHSGSNWWVTVENAVSPLPSMKFQSIVSDTVSQLVSPPEAPGNLLEDIADAGESTSQVEEEPTAATRQTQLHSDDGLNAHGPFEDLHIDDRVNALLKGYAIIPGRELETLGEALHMAFEHTEWEKWDNSEGFTRSRPCTWEPYRQGKDEECNRPLEIISKEVVETKLIASCKKDYTFRNCNPSDWFSGRWSCKGGDWKRNDDANQEKSSRRKLVLNDGYPLCQMPKSLCEDPRWCRKDELYYPSRSRKLNLPSWAFSLTEERTDCNGTSRSIQPKNPLAAVAARGAKGIMLPVIRINACVVDNQSSVAEHRAAVRPIDRPFSKSNRSLSSGNDGRSLSAEGASGSKRADEQKCIAPITPRDRVCTVEELQLHLGDWYYIDGAGHEHRYSSFVELQALVEKGTIQKHTSVFRKFDNIWVPVSYVALGSKASVQTQEVVAKVTESSAASSSQSEVFTHDLTSVCASSFHQRHPQFIGYTRGKLHELVMKSYKSREFAAAINEVLDPWINAKQPKKELESIQKSRRLEDNHIRSGKRARMAVDDSDDDYDIEGGAPKDDYSFDNLLSDAIFSQETNAGSEVNIESWGLLNHFILGRVFHFLRADKKSLAFSAATCRHWNSAVNFYRDISKQVDMSEAGSDCTDSMFHKIMNCYKNSKIASIILIGCTNISANALEEIILSFPSISSIDIRGCTQLRELTHRYQNIKWINSRSSRDSKSEDSYSKIKSLKQITEKGPTFPRAFKGSSSYLNEFSEGNFLQNNSSLDGRDSASKSFRQNFYKRKKLLDSRKSASLLSREARMRHFYYRKSENGYKRMEEFLAFSLKDIMKENTFDFFVPKVAEIEDKMKNGYYKTRGLNSVKEDVIRICRDAKKAKSRGDARDMNHIIMLFLRLATSLVQDPNESSRGRDELLKMLKDKSKKKHLRLMNERKSTNRSNDTAFFNGGADYGEYASDREVRRKLSKLNKRPLDSESETSDDINQSEGTEDDSESTVSDRENYMDAHSDGGMHNGYFMDEEGLDSTTEDREWGARMTKASLVPPVTRKYEVIDRYLIIADEEEVRRKMQVSLPEDYAEKLNAQKNGVEESDMEIPEVKDYKPRKQVGEEVLEQEVYGIDPYTHNLLLDSMPEELDWPLLEKHVFIEDTLLRVLNMQVRRFTGTGNAPMKYPLQPVVEEIHAKSEEEGDKRLMKMCNGILKAMRSRPEDNYVAYRKGLGVVCNKEEGFGEDDFVVEFLGEVYPAWKWFEKQDGIRSLQKDNKDPAPEFYNIYLERPKGDRDGYDLVVVDAMHKANYASRICHSCRPNCEAKVTAVDGQYQIGVYTVRPIGYAEEITFDYNSVTESKEEYEASVCLCGSQICRGSYLNLTGEGAFQKVLVECHGILDRHRLMLEACESNFVSEEDYNDLGRAGLGTCLLAGLPVWLVAYSARLVRFINFERTKLPEEILRHNLEEKRKFSLNISIDDEKNDAEVQAEGVYNQRLQNLALTLDKVRYVTRSVYHDPMQAPPPLKKLNPEEVVSVLWKGEGSLVEELLECMAPHTEEIVLNDLRSKILDHDPSGSDNLMEELQKSLLWLRDEVRSLPCTYKCRHDAAADLIHTYAYTKYFFRVQEYKTITSPPVYISPLDLGPKYADKLGSGFMEYCKKYGENYCLGQLIYWHTQNNIDPDCCLLSARRGCLSLPEIASFYAKANKPSRQRVYGPKTLRFMLSRMEKQPQKQWPNDKIWSFNSATQVFGSPMLDAAVNKSSTLNREMVHWLKNRHTIFQAKWDR